jgi:predicted type IV restriction endonuclease
VTQEQARSKISELIHKYQGMSEKTKSAITEAGVVHQFLDQFLRALGWPVDDPDRYKYELFVAGGRPDMTLMPETGGSLFVEAKRFGVIADLKRIKPSLSDIVTPGQMALPGMATDRTTEEQQAINLCLPKRGDLGHLN